jgi:hypothetical protein
MEIFLKFLLLKPLTGNEKGIQLKNLFILMALKNFNLTRWKGEFF